MKKIKLVKPEFDYKRLTSDFKAIAQSGILTRGPYLEKFEEKLRKYLKVKYVFATTSCTTALHLALLGAGIGPKDDVLVSDFSFPASANTVVQVGARPIFVDIDLDTFCLHLEDLKKKITVKTKAIMIVHAFGYPSNMAELMKIAKKNHLKVIEDAACALGSSYQAKKLGSWGDLGCFSFHPRKNITTGEGGAVVTNNPSIAKKIEILRNHGAIVKQNRWQFVECGYNYRLSELQAALGLEQMEKIDKITVQRQQAAHYYLKKLAKVPGLKLPLAPKKGEFNFQSFVILLPKEVNREKVIKKMASKNIETVLGTYAQHAQPPFGDYGNKPGDLKNSYYAQEHSLTLPLFGKIAKRQQDYIISNLSQIIKNA